jgi:hypothetical protein
MLLFIVTPFELFIAREVKFVTLAGINTPEDVPPNIRLDVATVAKLPGVPAIAGPFSVSVLAPTVKEPAVRVSVPFTVKSAPSVIFLLVLKLFNPFAIELRVISAPVPIVRLEVTPPVNEPAP